MLVNKFKMIVLFGGGGFIGSHLTKWLLKSNPDSRVVCMDLTDEKLKKLIPEGGYEFERCHIRKNKKRAAEIIGESDFIIDLVAYANPAIYIKKPMEVVELNLFDNLRIVELCEKYKKPLMQFSTCEVYGKSGGTARPFHEDESDLIVGPIRNHRWIYSSAKQLLERILHAKGLKNTINYIILRPFNFIGPEMDFLIKQPEDGNPRVFPQFMSALLYGNPMILVDGGNNYRSFTYIDDAVDGIIRIINNFDAMRNQIVNVGNLHNETSIKGLAYLMKDLFKEITGEDSQCEIIDVKGTEFYGEGYEDCDRRVPDISKLKSLGWNPQYDLRSTFKSGMEYYINLYRK